MPLPEQNVAPEVNTVVKIGASGMLVERRVSKSIDASIGAYAVNDVVNDTDCCTTATCWTLEDAARVVGGGGYIVGAIAVSESENVTPALTVFLFNAVPTAGGDTGLTDNSANVSPDSGDLDKFIGKVDFNAMESLGTTDSHANISPSTPLPIPFKCIDGSKDLSFIVVTRTIFTQTATDELTFIFEIEQY